MSDDLVIFTDLDGTLLDHETYGFEPAREALQRLRDRGIPLVFCSSKTRAEIEPLRRRLKNEHPFIVENGGAVFIPRNYFLASSVAGRNVDDYVVVEQGRRYEKLRQALDRIRRETGLPLVGFGDLTVEQVMEHTGLSRKEAERAKRREYDEPFFPTRPLSADEEEKLQRAAQRYGLHLSRGGRFYHLTGDNDKGRAVRLLVEAYARTLGRPPRTVAIGDSPNDLPMLVVVDVPVLVQKPNGEYDPVVMQRIRPRLAAGVGPAGWNEAVLALLDELIA